MAPAPSSQASMQMAAGQGSSASNVHAEAGMVHVTYDRCSHGSCTNTTRWGLLTDNAATVCGTHIRTKSRAPLPSILQPYVRWGDVRKSRDGDSSRSNLPTVPSTALRETDLPALCRQTIGREVRLAQEKPIRGTPRVGQRLSSGILMVPSIIPFFVVVV